jgi:protein KRI1
VKRRVKFDDAGNAETVVDEDAESQLEDDSEDEEEDEEGEELTPALDAAIMRTLAMIRKKDEGVYGSGNVLEGMSGMIWFASYM